MQGYRLAATLVISVSLLFGCSQSDETDVKADKSSEDIEKQKSASNQLDGVSDEYRDFAINEIDEFVEKTDTFANAVIDGDLEKAKELYAPARMHYERSEPIAEVFPDLDPKIDARDGDVPEEEWGGYHRIEKGLWEEDTTEGYEEYAKQLIKDTKELRAKVETVEVTPDILITGAVDLLNEVSTSKVTGEEDRYSHTDLYDFAANVQGSEKIFDLMKPAVEAKDDALADDIQQRFDHVYDLLENHKKDGGYVSYTKLDEEEVKKLAQSINELAEPLSQIGIVMEG